MLLTRLRLVILRQDMQLTINVFATGLLVKIIPFEKLHFFLDYKVQELM